MPSHLNRRAYGAGQAFVSTERHLWLNLADVTEEAPVLPSELFGTSVDGNGREVQGGVGVDCRL